MIIINKPWIENNSEKSICYCEIFIDEKKDVIWFEVDKKYGVYLVDDRVDAYLIGVLNWAMRENHNIVCKAPVTEELLYNIKTTLIPSLARYGKSLYSIEVQAPIISALPEGIGVGTGCSCGIDSFSAIYNHINTEYSGMDLTHLCLNNVGAYNECYQEYGIDKVKKERYEITDKVAKELNLELIKTDSNFSDIIKQNHYLTNTYSGTFAIYMLQKLWKKYYLASVGLDYSKFTIIDNDVEDSAHYDLLTLQCFSIPGLRIFSEGGEKNRLEKTKDIVEFKTAQKYLHVCVSKSTNCGVCTKCNRTLVTLDYLNKLENFSEVFDIDYYIKNKNKYYKWLYEQHLKKDLMNEPSYQGLKDRKEFKKAVRFYKVYVPIVLGVKKIIPIKLKEKLKRIIKKDN